MKTVSNLPRPETKAFSSIDELTAFICDCAVQKRCIVAGKACDLPERPSRSIDFFVETPQIANVVEHCVPDQVLSIECGISVGRLNQMLSETRQWFPVPEAFNSLTLMEVIDRGLSGSYEHCFGGLRELVLGATIISADGDAVKCGGKVVKNVSGYDLTKLVVGSHGIWGYLLSAHLRLFALPDEFRTICFAFEDIDKLHKASTGVLRAGLPLLSVAWAHSNRFVDCSAVGLPADRLVLCIQTCGPHQLLDELNSAVCDIVGSAPRYLSDSEQKNLWQALDEPVAYDSDLVLVQGPAIFLNEIVKALADLPPVKWCFRPGAHKVVVQASSAQERLLILDRAAQLCTKFGVTATAACRDDGYLWKVNYLPVNDPVRAELYTNLKRELDPEGVFNPLADL